MIIADMKENIRTFIGNYITFPNLEDNYDFFASGAVNSLFAMQLVMFVEKEFELKVENEDLDPQNFNTINAIVDFVTRKKIGRN